MSHDKPNVVRQRTAARSKFLGNHIEDVMEFLLRFLGRGSDGVAPFKRRNVSDVAAVIIAAADDLVIEESFHRSIIKLSGFWASNMSHPARRQSSGAH